MMLEEHFLVLRKLPRLLKYRLRHQVTKHTYALDDEGHVGIGRSYSVDTSATSTKQCEAITNVAIRIMRVKGMDEQRKIEIDCVII